MPVTYEFDRSHTLIRTRLSGNVTVDEVMDHLRELEADPALPARLDALADLTEMDSLPTTGLLKLAAGGISRLRQKVRWGALVIVASGDALYGMSRMFQVVAQGYFSDSCVVRTLEEAEAWLAARSSTGDRD